MADDIPRRCCINKLTPAEKAIDDAMGVVEAAGADVRLTDAVILLGAAKDAVADFVDGIDKRRFVRSANDLDAARPDGELLEVCLCAAMQLQNGRVIRGHRHDDCIQTILKLKSAGQDVGHPREAVQGFLTSRGRFVDRREAMKLQKAAGVKSADYGGVSAATSCSARTFTK